MSERMMGNYCNSTGGSTFDQDQGSKRKYSTDKFTEEETELSKRLCQQHERELRKEREQLARERKKFEEERAEWWRASSVTTEMAKLQGTNGITFQEDVKFDFESFFDEMSGISDEKILVQIFQDSFEVTCEEMIDQMCSLLKRLLSHEDRTSLTLDEQVMLRDTLKSYILLAKNVNKGMKEKETVVKKIVERTVQKHPEYQHQEKVKDAVELSWNLISLVPPAISYLPVEYSEKLCERDYYSWTERDPKLGYKLTYNRPAMLQGIDQRVVVRALVGNTVDYTHVDQLHTQGEANKEVTNAERITSGKDELICTNKRRSFLKPIDEIKPEENFKEEQQHHNSQSQTRTQQNSGTVQFSENLPLTQAPEHPQNQLPCMVKDYQPHIARTPTGQDFIPRILCFIHWYTRFISCPNTSQPITGQIPNSVAKQEIAVQQQSVVSIDEHYQLHISPANTSLYSKHLDYIIVMDNNDVQQRSLSLMDLQSKMGEMFWTMPMMSQLTAACNQHQPGLPTTSSKVATLDEAANEVHKNKSSFRNCVKEAKTSKTSSFEVSGPTKAFPQPKVSCHPGLVGNKSRLQFSYTDREEACCPKSDEVLKNKHQSQSLTQNLKLLSKEKYLHANTFLSTCDVKKTKEKMKVIKRSQNYVCQIPRDGSVFKQPIPSKAEFQTATATSGVDHSDIGTPSSRRTRRTEATVSETLDEDVLPCPKRTRMTIETQMMLTLHK